MLGKVLSKSTCAECRFCCSFRRCSLWETPLFLPETVQKLREEAGAVQSDGAQRSKPVRSGEAVQSEAAQRDDAVSGNAPNFMERVVNGEKCCQMNLEYKYKTDDSQEEAACEFLDAHTGCTLSCDDKPFDCKIWPLRIMKKDEELVIALTPTCPAINKVGVEAMTELAKGGLGAQIFEYADAHPFIIKEYKQGFPVLMSRG
jgi:hypothetical protein